MRWSPTLSQTWSRQGSQAESEFEKCYVHEAQEDDQTLLIRSKDPRTLHQILLGALYRWACTLDHEQGCDIHSEGGSFGKMGVLCASLSSDLRGGKRQSIWHASEQAWFWTRRKKALYNKKNSWHGLVQYRKYLPKKIINRIFVVEERYGAHQMRSHVEVADEEEQLKFSFRTNPWWVITHDHQGPKE